MRDWDSSVFLEKLPVQALIMDWKDRINTYLKMESFHSLLVQVVIWEVIPNTLFRRVILAKGSTGTTLISVNFNCLNPTMVRYHSLLQPTLAP